VLDNGTKSNFEGFRLNCVRNSFQETLDFKIRFERAGGALNKAFVKKIETRSFFFCIRQSCLHPVKGNCCSVLCAWNNSNNPSDGCFDG